MDADPANVNAAASRIQSRLVCIVSVLVIRRIVRSSQFHCITGRAPLSSKNQSPTSACSSLARRTKESAALRLHDATNLGLATARASDSGAIVDSVVILIVARFVQRIAVRTIAERAPFMFNRRFEDLGSTLLDT